MDWQSLIDLFPISYYKIFIRYFLSALLAFLIFYVWFKNQQAIPKIQKKFPKRKDYVRDLTYSLITIAIFGVIALISFVVLKPYNLLYDSFDQRSLGYWIATIPVIFLIHDFYFYWIHRLMHLPLLFQSVHRIHHLSTNPSPWTAYAFHPYEAILEGLIILILSFTVPTHRVIIVGFMIFQIIYNVYGHLGFELFPPNFNKTIIGKWINTSVAHNQHHMRYTGNYGLYTLIWDRLFGTLRVDYDQSYAAARPGKD